MMADVKIISWQDHLVIPPYKVLIKLSDSHFINLLGIDRWMSPPYFLENNYDHLSHGTITVIFSIPTFKEYCQQCLPYYSKKPTWRSIVPPLIDFYQQLFKLQGCRLIDFDYFRLLFKKRLDIPVSSIYLKKFWVSFIISLNWYDLHIF